LAVTVKVDYSYRVQVQAYGGGAWAESRLLMAVEGPGAGTVQSLRLREAIAAVVWTATEEAEAVKVWTGTFAISAAGGEFLVLTGVQSAATAGAEAGASAQTRGNIRSITVEAKS
jgi:hypothetical protein